MEFLEHDLGTIFSEAFHSGEAIKANEIHNEGQFPVFGGNGLRGYSSRYNQDGEYVIIGRQGAYCGNARYYKGKAFLTEHAIVAKPSAEYDVVYLANLLSAINLSRFQGQSAQPGLSVDTLSNVRIKHIDTHSQKAIGTFIYSIDSNIALNRAINQNLRARREQRENLFSLCRAEAVNGDVSRNLEATPDRSSEAAEVRRVA